MYKLVLILLIALVGYTNAEYDDILSRTKMFPIAAAAYNENPEPCIKATFGADAELVNKYNVLCDTTDLCFSYIGLSHQDKAIFVGFRGSAGVSQLIAEGIDSMLKPHVQAFDLTEVSEYFFNAFNLTWHAGLQNDFLHLSQKHWDYEIWISGHSLGGAIASITATAISYYYPTTEDRIKLYTYGQPRLGDFAYALYHDFIVPNSYRVTHSHDLVVNIPPLSFLYFYHHKNEIFFNNSMAPGSEYKKCSDSEDFSCSAGTILYSIDDHVNYYGVSVSGYGAANCPNKLV